MHSPAFACLNLISRELLEHRGKYHFVHPLAGARAFGAKPPALPSRMGNAPCADFWYDRLFLPGSAKSVARARVPVDFSGKGFFCSSRSLAPGNSLDSGNIGGDHSRLEQPARGA